MDSEPAGDVVERLLLGLHALLGASGERGGVLHTLVDLKRMRSSSVSRLA